MTEDLLAKQLTVLPDDNGVKVDWEFKDEVSVGVRGKDLGGLTLPILKVYGGRLQSKWSSEPFQMCPVPLSF